MEYCSQCKKLLAQGTRVCPEDGAEVLIAKDLPEGVRLGVYRFEKKIGQGGMGSVYLAQHTVLNKRCAIKILLPRFAAQPEVCARFLQEARAANAIKHDNVVQIYDFGRSPDGGAFLVMEFLEGEPFDKYLKRKGALPHEILVEIFYQLASALDEAHKNNVVHRDLKPENVFLQELPNNRLMTKVLDFGVAKIQGDLAVPGLTRAGTVVGTPQYIAPEQLTGQTATGSADIYSLGVILFQAATGRLPFLGPKLSDFAQQHIFEKPPAPRSMAPDLHEGVEALLLRMLAKKVEERPASMGEVAQALGALRVGRADPLLVTPPPMTIEGPPKVSKKGLWAAFGGAVLALSFLGAYLAFATPPPPPDPYDAAISAAEKGDFAPLSQLAQQQLSQAFTSSDAARRRGAILALYEAKDFHDLSPLISALQDPDPEVRRLAVVALGASDKEEARNALREASGSAGKQLKFQISLARFQLSPKEEELNQLLVSALEVPTQRFEAALSLAKGGNSAGREILQEAMAASGNAARGVAAAEGLFFLERDEAARQHLISALQSPETLISAALALASQKEPAGAEALVKQVRTHGDVDSAVALASLGDARARPVLLKSLSSSDSKQKQRAALALSLLRDKNDLGRLLAVLQDPDPSTQDTAARAIVAIYVDGAQK